MSYANHSKYQCVYRSAQVDFSSLKIHLSCKNRTYTLYNEKAPSLHHAGTVKRNLANYRESIVLINPQKQETKSINHTHQCNIFPFLPAGNHSSDVLCKCICQIKHQEYTGVSSKIIKEHIAYVLKSEHKHKVIIRTPLIPTMTATEENIIAICQFLVDIDPEVQYELLNYNPLASAKYDLVEFEYGVDKQYKMFNQQQMQHFYDIVKAVGLKNLIIE